MKALTALIAFIVIGYSASPAFACACCETYSVTGVKSWDTLNMRSGPGPRFQIVHKLPHDDGCITMTGERQGNWVRITANSSGATGWVNAKYLIYRHGPAAPAPGGVQYNACVVGVRSNDVLNIRARRSGSAPILGIIPPDGDGVQVYQDAGSWSRVQYGGVTGWVANRFLDTRC